MILKLRAVLCIVLALLTVRSFGQAPNISYATPQVYTVQVPIAPLSPTNTGGAVPNRAAVTLGSGFNVLRGPAVDAAGNVYFADNGNSQVKEIQATTNAVLILGSGFNHPAGTAVDAAGNVYVSDNGNGAVKKIPVGGGPVVTLATGFASVYGVAVDGAGNVYASDANAGVIKKISPDGLTITTYSSGFNIPTGITFDAAGNLYVADRNSSSIKMVPPGGGAPVTFYSGFGSPNGVAVDAAGNVYVADYNHPAVQEIPVAGGRLIDVGTGISSPVGITCNASGNLYVADAGDNTIKEIKVGNYSVNASLPPGLSLDSGTGVISGTPTVASASSNYIITAFNSSGSSSTTVNITVNQPAKPVISYPSPQSFTALVAITPIWPVNTGGAVYPSSGYTISPSLPPGLAFDQTTGMISGTPSQQSNATDYTVTASNNGGSGTAVINIAVLPYSVPTVSYPTPQVYTINVAIKPLTPSSSGVGPAGSTNFVNLASGFFNITGVAVDQHGNVYVAEDDGNDVKEILAAGGVVTLGSGFSSPTGVAVDAAGNVYVADNGHSAVKKIAAGSGTISTLGSGFSGPYGVAVDVAGNVYVGDANNNAVKKIAAGNGTITTLGSGFNHPTGVAVDANGNVYVADRGNQAIKKISTANVTTVLVVFGSGNPNGVAVDAAGNVYVADTTSPSITELLAAGGFEMIGSNLSTPTDVAVDASGIVYIADNGHGSVEKTMPTGGYFISPALPAGLVFDSGTGIISGTPTALSAPTNYTIKAYNIGGSGTAALNIAVINPNTGLAGLTVSNGTLSPGFITSTTAYKVTETNDISAITVTPTTSDPSYTVTVNGAAVFSGSPSSSIPLAVGSNAIQVIVKSGVGTTIGVYNVTAIRTGTSNAALAQLSLNNATLSPAFSATTSAYTASVPYNTTSISVIAGAADPYATIKLNGTVVSSGAATTLPLVVGSNKMTVVVIAADGVTRQAYSINVTRSGPSTNDNLSALAVTPGTFAPSFAAGTLNYTVNVSNATSSIAVTPTAADANSTVTVNQIVLSSGATLNVPLTVGTNTISIVVTAQDNATTKTYTITATRALSSDATLANLELAIGTLVPAFTPATTTYTANLPNGYSALTIAPTANEANAIIFVNGTRVASGSPSPLLHLAVGANTITTTVTAADGVTTQTYTVTITRAPSANANLASFTLSSGTFFPVFNANTLTYNATVTYATTSVAITPVVADPTATITVNGTAVASGTASVDFPLVVGANNIITTVTAQDGVTAKTYTAVVKRTAPSANANLANLVLSSGTLSPAFATNTIVYTASVANAVTTINVTPTAADGSASITVNGVVVASGSASADIALPVGSTLITTVLKAQNGTTIKTYRITVTRAKSSDASLAGLALSSGTLTPVFASGTANYSASVGNTTTAITLTPTTNDGGATVTVNGAVVASGSASAGVPLNVGANTITTLVTAQDGVTTQTYTVTVTRAPSSDAGLANLTLSAGTLTPSFLTATTTYSASVVKAVSSITITPTVDEPNATVKVAGKVVASGTAVPVTLVVGANTFRVIVTAQDGVTTSTYTLTITRLNTSTNANLAGLKLNKGALSPAFAAATTSYTASVVNGATTIAVTPTTADATATVTVNGTAVASGSASPDIALNVGSNVINVVTTAQDGTTQKTYTITVTRAPSSNATLSLIRLKTGVLSPAFTPATIGYSANVANGVGLDAVTPTASDATATITVDGNPVASGSTSPVENLSVGNNSFNIIVTAQDGTTTKIYTVIVNRAASPITTPDESLSVNKPVEDMSVTNDGITVHAGISPNGDGINDYLVIEGIGNYPDNKLQIMNRNGALVYEAKGYDNASKTFDGHSNKNGQMQLPGTYFYSLEYTANGAVKHKTGYLVLKY